MKTKVYYIMDTMCGWCYGMSGFITEIQEKYKDVYDFNLLPGGMLIGDDVIKVDASFSDFLKDSNKKVEKLTGKKFGKAYNENVIEKKSIILDSLSGAKAVVIIQKLKKEVAFSFLKKVQEAFFVEGKDMNNLDGYMEIAKSFNISDEEFEKEFNSEEIRLETFKCFEMAGTMGVEVFPTVVVEELGKATIKSKGYSNFEELDRIFASLKS
ncbi:DsbA family protein [Clostridium sp. CS001]|uniref:DsbA family protein n=1 Tax=Clostridium sp. CS001 TaxID=2880648 RepID=UPI001CF43263|nr:DsbA family protein [Clostridium sp. CS001]MCB2288518.1 DsbA family protein [Clostridium sp. CS001]